MKTLSAKITALILTAALLVACSMTTTIRYSPLEKAAIEASGSVIVRTKDGAETVVRRPRLGEGRLTGTSDRRLPVSIETAAIDSVTVKKTDITYVLLFGALAAIEGGLAIGASTAPAPPPAQCCPLIFSFDGTRFVLEAEPYGGAICRALERAEWIPLERLRDMRGLYRLRMANELREVEHADEVKLLAVDHPADVRVLPDPSGRLYTVRDPLPPLRAVDGNGRDVAAALAERDGRFWESEAAGRGPGEDGLRDEIVVEFSKPAGARTAKLVAEAWTTTWGSRIAKRFLECLGTDLPAFFRNVNARGPAYARLMAWFAREELYLLKVQVETPEGWAPRAVLYGGGPFVAKEKAYLINVSDILGTRLRVRLRPPAGFWRLDSLAVDYSEDAPISVREIKALAARDGKGADVRSLLVRTDGVFHDMPERGDYVDLTFPAPAVAPGLERSLILKASGWYDPLPRSEGEPRRDLVRRILDEPGFTVRLARNVLSGKGD